MADTSIVSQEELEAIASASGFAVWELEQVVADANFRFLRDEFRAGRLGIVVNPEQALEAPSQIGALVQAGAEGTERITDVLEGVPGISDLVLAGIEGTERIGDALSKGVSVIGAKLKELGLQGVVLATAVVIIALVIKFRR